MPGLNEADTCRVFITPALQKAGWGDPHWRIAEQHYFTDGQIFLVGDGHRRRKGKKADYILRFTESFPIATVEAKAEDLEPGAGLQQSKDFPSPIPQTATALRNGTSRPTRNVL